MHPGHELLVEVHNNSLLTVGNPQGIFDQQLRPHTIQSLYITIILIRCIKLKVTYERFNNNPQGQSYKTFTSVIYERL